MANKKISDFPAKIAPVNDDLFVISDSETANGDGKKVTVEELFNTDKTITGDNIFTGDTSIHGDLGNGLTLKRTTPYTFDPISLGYTSQINFDTTTDGTNNVEACKIDHVYGQTNPFYVNSLQFTLLNQGELVNPNTPEAAERTMLTLYNSFGYGSTTKYIETQSEIRATEGIKLGGIVDANLLDDYEEGTWFPAAGNFVATDSSTDFVDKVATYTKIGNVVRVEYRVGIPENTDTGEVNILGSSLPFEPVIGSLFGSYTGTDSPGTDSTTPSQFLGNLLGNTYYDTTFVYPAFQGLFSTYEDNSNATYWGSFTYKTTE